MVIGLDTFKEHFKDYQDQYVLIGGSASLITLQEYGLPFRVTKDLDIVLIVEALTKEYVKHFWLFIQEGQYDYFKANRSPCFYRFQNPKKNNYPAMIEILSRNNALEEIPKNMIKRRLSIDEETVSLSAIILEEGYYELIMEHQITIDEVPTVDSLCLILLKMKACINLFQAKLEGKNINSEDIKKHKRDVFRIAQVLSGEERLSLSDNINKDVLEFMSHVKENPVILKDIKVPGEIDDYFKQFGLIFNL